MIPAGRERRFQRRLAVALDVTPEQEIGPQHIKIGIRPEDVRTVILIGDVNYFLAGDATYTQQALIEGRVDGVSPREQVSLRTMQTIVKLAQQQPTVYLPAHDTESGHRLANAITIRAGKDAIA